MSDVPNRGVEAGAQPGEHASDGFPVEGEPDPGTLPTGAVRSDPSGGNGGGEVPGFPRPPEHFDPADDDGGDTDAVASATEPAGQAPATETAGQAETAGWESELEQVRRERDEYLDGLRRSQADFENYRKRVVKQQSEQADRATENLVRSLLPVLDTVDLAMAHLGGGPSLGSGAADGEAGAPAAATAREAPALAQVADGLRDVLAGQGLSRIEPQGEPFDPNEHEAVMHEASDEGSSPEVLEVLRAGWKWKGRVLRAAMVKVKG